MSEIKKMAYKYQPIKDEIFVSDNECDDDDDNNEAEEITDEFEVVSKKKRKNMICL